jgi:hypothetical protein
VEYAQKAVENSGWVSTLALSLDVILILTWLQNRHRAARQGRSGVRSWEASPVQVVRERGQQTHFLRRHTRRSGKVVVNQHWNCSKRLWNFRLWLDCWLTPNKSWRRPGQSALTTGNSMAVTSLLKYEDYSNTFRDIYKNICSNFGQQKMLFSFKMLQNCSKLKKITLLMMKFSMCEILVPIIGWK